jgi:glycosyltransferase involved in cell wall biosynthesis
MRFHVLGLSHTRTSRAVSCDAFAQKIRLLCKMLVGEGHHVIHYGVEGSDPECSENVTVLSEETFEAVHGAYDYRRAAGFDLGFDNAAFREYTERAVQEIEVRKQPGDFLLCPFGLGHKPIADRFPDMIVVESGIGYISTFAKWRVFESYAWMHYQYGLQTACLSPSLYDAVIPNYLDMADYPYRAKKDDYFIFLGRPSELKGLNITNAVCKELKAKLYVAGQGELPAGVEAEHLGVISIEERAKWVGGAKALFCPTYYIEPFGTVAIEAAAYGTPVITTDVGAFTETVLHGVTGYRCRTLEQFVWAAQHIGRIKPKTCREWAKTNFSTRRVAKMYTEYFAMLATLYADERGWYAPNPERRDLRWLAKGYV